MLRIFRSPLWLFIATVSLAQSQQNHIRFNHISTEQGLSQDIVTSIIQDKQGFMWFATEDGLNRYDGYSIKVYKHRPRDSTSIAANRYPFLFVDGDGSLWASSTSVMSRYDPDRDAFTNVRVSFNGSTACTDDQNEMWVGTDIGLRKFNRQTGTFTVPAGIAPDEFGLYNNQVLSLESGRDGLLWVGTSRGLFHYNPSTGRSEQVHFPGDSSAAVTLLLESQEYLWFVVQNQGLKKLHLKSHRTDTFRTGVNSASLSDGRVLSICEGRRGTIWVGTFSGLDRYDSTSNSFTHYRADANDKNSLLGERVYSIYEDMTGALWVGTYRGGVNRADPLSQQFAHYFHSPSNPNTINSNTVLALCEDSEGTLWIGTDKSGITKYIANESRFMPYFSHRNWGTTTAICEDRNGRLWIGTQFGLMRFDRRTNSVVEFHHQPNDTTSLRSDFIRSLFLDKDGALWIGYQLDQLTKYDDRTGRFIHFHIKEKDNIFGIWHISGTRNGDLLLGTMYGRNGLYRFERSTGRFSPIGKTPDGSSRVQGSVRAVVEDSSGILWIGTWGNGLYQYYPPADSVTQFTQFEGLANDYVKGILPDARNNLWISTENGLSRFDPNTRKFKSFAATEGLQSNFFWSGSACKGRDGRMYFGGTNGISAFYPDSVRENLNIPPIVITRFMVLNEPMMPFRSNTGPDEIHLSDDQDFFSFEFVALNFTATEKNQYAYMMEGFDKNWIHTGNRRYAAYTHLDPGSYTFRVKGTNNDGVWNEQGASIFITISPPFWQTWWFRLTVVLTLVGTLYELYRYRVRRLLEIERLRGRIAADLHDDVGSELGHITIASQLLLRKVSLPEKEQQQLSSISTSALRASEMMKEVVWFLNPKNDSLNNIVLKMRSLADTQLNELDVAFDAPLEELSDNMDPEVKRNIVLMYKEILHNIAKHARATNVTIKIQVHSHRLSLTITDNGVGFEPASPGHGNGLNNMRSRATQIGGNLSVRSTVGGGTTVALDVRV